MGLMADLDYTRLTVDSLLSAGVDSWLVGQSHDVVQEKKLELRDQPSTGKVVRKMRYLPSLIGYEHKVKKLRTRWNVEEKLLKRYDYSAHSSAHRSAQRSLHTWAESISSMRLQLGLSMNVGCLETSKYPRYAIIGNESNQTSTTTIQANKYYVHMYLVYYGGQR